ncbi:MAG TPA: hypothetical protein PLV51_11220 [Lentimicrobium sp.]|jgi:hypothetical protein|nr:hypothetical protein [Lentimicrobium sp.]
MSKHLKITVLKTLAFALLIGLWNYWISNNYDEFHSDTQTLILRTLGTGVLFGITIYFIDKPKDKPKE